MALNNTRKQKIKQSFINDVNSFIITKKDGEKIKHIKVVDWDKVFPRSGKPDLRKTPTRHQRNKIKQLIEAVKEHGGTKRFHPQRKSRKRDIIQASTGTGEIFKGYFAQGEMRVVGDWAVLEIKSSGVELYYYPFKRQLNTTHDAGELTREALMHRPHVKTVSVGISNKGGQFDMVGINEADNLIDKARATFAKYAQMAKDGLKRENYYNQLAVHPREWMTGIAYTRMV